MPKPCTINLIRCSHQHVFTDVAAFGSTIRWRASQLQQHSRGLANVRDAEALSNAWFTRNVSLGSPNLPDFNNKVQREQGPDERTLKLGKTVRTLQEHLPSILLSPLPQDVLSPSISLHLFPSTHPHLPTVSGRISYAAALWTAPVAWGRMPVIGNVKLIIVSARMVKDGQSSVTYQNERLIVRWKTTGKRRGEGVGPLNRDKKGKGGQLDRITEFLGRDARDDEEFSGLFIFEFDSEGRISKHIIEHAQEGRNFEKMTRVVSMTDWLIGRAKGNLSEQQPSLVLGCSEIENKDTNASCRLEGDDQR